MACTKKPYPNQFTALRALDAILAAGKPGKQPVRAYPCHDCHRWHLTSKKLTGRKVPRWEQRQRKSVAKRHGAPGGVLSQSARRSTPCKQIADAGKDELPEEDQSPAL